jgi:hypothetical protein
MLNRALCHSVQSYTVTKAFVDFKLVKEAADETWLIWKLFHSSIVSVTKSLLNLLGQCQEILHAMAARYFSRHFSLRDILVHLWHLWDILRDAIL